MKVRTFEELFEDQVKDLCRAENQLIKALPRMAKAAKSPELKSALEASLEQARKHAERLESICQERNITPGRRKCVGIQGLLDEGKEFIGTGSDPLVRDAALIGAAQKVEHYQIAAYGTLCAHARQMHASFALQLLGRTLAEEKETDERLTRIAMGSINPQAAAVDDRDSEWTDDRRAGHHHRQVH